MVQKKTKIKVTDNSGARWIQIFHLYRGFSRKFSYTGLFIKASIRKVSHRHIITSKKILKPVFKGEVCKCLLVKTYNEKKIDGSKIHFMNNSSLFLWKKRLPKSTRIFGPASYKIKRLRFLILFKVIL